MKLRLGYFRFLSKLASDREFVGGTERRSGAYIEVREDPSTIPTSKLPAEVEFRKKSIFSSLKLTLFLLTFAFLLVFFGTLYQVEYGIYEAQKHYFQSWFVVWKYPSYAPYASYIRWLYVPLLGGYLLGTLLIINLVSTFVRRFKWSYKKVGVNLIHGGILLLLISAFITGFLAQESQIVLYPGIPNTYSETIRENELVVIDTSEVDSDYVISFPASILNASAVLAHPKLPFQLRVEAFYPNSVVGKETASAPQLSVHKASEGVGKAVGLQAFNIPLTYKPDAINTASAYVSVSDADSQLGTWLVSNVFDAHFPPQAFEYKGKKYEISLRFKRFYNPYSLELLEFKHETYPGTDIPKHFSSLVSIKHFDDVEEREALIYMNHPLRYEGSTFYQSSFIPGENASVLQVVRNPGWILPYICIFIIGLGLVIHFSIQLNHFLRQK